MTLIHQIRNLLFNALQLTPLLLENTTDILKAGETLSDHYKHFIQPYEIYLKCVLESGYLRYYKFFKTH